MGKTVAAGSVETGELKEAIQNPMDSMHARKTGIL